MLSLTLAAAALAAATQAPPDPARPVVDAPASKAAATAQGVTVFMINDADADAPLEPPSTIETIARDGTRLRLVMDPTETPGPSVAAHGFAKLRYRVAGASATGLAGQKGAPERPGETVALATVNAPPADEATISAAPETTAAVAPSEAVTVSSRGRSSSFFDRIYPYEPIYGVWGPGTTGAKLQVSFAARPIGGTGALSNLRFAYTQQVFWRVNDRSGPVRSLIYSPELFYELPVARTAQLAIGYRHDSNGGGVADSVDLNRFYVRLNKSIDVGDGWQVNLTPMVWYNAFSHGVATDIDDFWGYASITASVEQRDGIKLSVYARGNPATGKGGSEIFLSYPIKRFGLGDAGFYLFGQLFTGYGEQLRDYNRDDTRARIGIAFTR